MHCYKIIHNIILLLFKVYKIWISVLFFIPDIDNFCFLSFSLSVLLEVYQCHILCKESTFDFVDFSLVCICFVFH